MKPNRQSTIQSSEEKFKDFLKVTKVFRDPVHGDIWVTQLEKEIIDNVWFQRLRRTRQLGPSHLVYPGANHTRFEHSIGAVHIAQKIIESINKNHEYSFEDGTPFSDIKISDKEIFIIRLIALLHDCAHVPFGHTLESEGNILGPHHQMIDDYRRGLILTNIFPVVNKYLLEHRVDIGTISEILGDQLYFDKNDIPIPPEKRTKIGIIEKILIAEENAESVTDISNKEYIAEIVGNTICADLLDYLKRDAYYTGLEMTYDPRILSYFVIKEDQIHTQNLRKSSTLEGDLSIEPDYHAAILLEKKENKKGNNLRRDVLSACVDLLNMRYSLAEKVYSHRVKTVLSAMVIKCVYCAINGGFIDKNPKNGEISRKGWTKLMNLSDDALIYEIASLEINENSNEYLRAAQKIADAYTQRNLYTIADSKETFDTDKWCEVGKCHNPDSRYKLERKIEEVFDFPEGSIIIYTPEKNPGKAAGVRVYLKSQNPPIMTLEELGENSKLDYRTIRNEIAAINDRYPLLWKFYILLAKDLKSYSDDVKKVSKELIEDGKYSENAIRIRSEKIEEHEHIGISAITQKTVKNIIKAESDPRGITNIDELLKETEKKRVKPNV